MLSSEMLSLGCEELQDEQLLVEVWKICHYTAWDGSFVEEHGHSACR